jgi:Cdc6-like AAA superfamily ATPase
LQLEIGNPGSGKTVLAGSIVDELQRNGRISSPPTPVCYYFFNQTSGKANASTNAYRAIAAQIFHDCHRIDRIHDVFAIITADMATDTIASESELLDLICQCLHNLPSMYILLDGIDECIDNLKLRHEIVNWCKSFTVKIVVLSRPDIAWLRNLIEPWCKINFNEEGLSPDIYWYLRPELEEMLEEHYLPETSDLKKNASKLGKTSRRYVPLCTRHGWIS